MNRGVKFHRAKHDYQNRWIWYRVNDTALVYEQYYDGSEKSYIKYFIGGIVENPWLFTKDFRIKNCANPFVALQADLSGLQHLFSLQFYPEFNNFTN